ncbi:expressed unknown protein [Seminavis robusta]|uniref:Uncharacterized protein n=1 Tax=Seminavis robusta TaxID=568900 RepID=A0A9N8HRF2_9STRA|nr:expressed unknown protein [Seminavis robusta]|eukprot:Sro1313_g261940.1 n/a (331) ;mRNA; f:17756-18748
MAAMPSFKNAPRRTVGKMKNIPSLSSALVVVFLCLLAPSTDAFVVKTEPHEAAKNNYKDTAFSAGTTTRVSAVASGREPTVTECFPVQLNEFFKQPVPKTLKRSVSLYYEGETPESDLDSVTILTSAPSVPGCPRPLWLVMLASLPTGLLWYGYYKFAVEEEMLQMELERGNMPRGFGGYGTLGPFSYGMLLGPMAALFHVPGGLHWSILGVAFIYYTQFLLYDRVNELFTDEGKEAPLNVWWCLPIFFPFNIIVGLRQVHFLSQYLYEKRGANPPPKDPVADFFPFIGAEPFSWQEFLLTPRLWCRLLQDVEGVDNNKLPAPIREILSK